MRTVHIVDVRVLALELALRSPLELAFRPTFFGARSAQGDILVHNNPTRSDQDGLLSPLDSE